MVEFDIKRSSRKCSVQDRALLPGEFYISALLQTDESTQRCDYCLEAWDGPPENCIGWWKAQIPEVVAGKIYWAPNEILYSYFDHLRNSPVEQDAAYVMALLMVQKRLLSLEEFVDTETGQQMVLLNRHQREMFAIDVLEIEPARTAEIQQQLDEKLFTDQPLDFSDDGEDGE